MAGRGEFDDFSAGVDARGAVEGGDDEGSGGQPGQGDVTNGVLEVGGRELDGALEGGVDRRVGLVLVPLGVFFFFFFFFFFLFWVFWGFFFFFWVV